MCLALLGFLVGGCGGDDGGDESPITGDSALTVHNNDDKYGATVYFDGAFIGEVGKRSARTWQVPSGSHEVRVDNADLDQTEAERRRYSFSAGGTVHVNVEWVSLTP